jgi:hypothetical protein
MSQLRETATPNHALQRTAPGVTIYTAVHFSAFGCDAALDDAFSPVKFVENSMLKS